MSQKTKKLIEEELDGETNSTVLDRIERRRGENANRQPRSDRYKNHRERE